MNKKILFIGLLFFIFFIQSCSNHKKDLQLIQLEKQLNRSKDLINRQLEHSKAKINVMRCNSGQNREILIYYACLKIDSITKKYISPKDSLSFCMLSNSKSKEFFYSTLSAMQASANFINDKKMDKHLADIKSKIDYVDMSDDFNIWKINNLTNQISVLNFQENLYNILIDNMMNSDCDFDLELKTVETENGNVGENYTAYLTYVSSEMFFDQNDSKLIKLTLDGKNVNVDYHFSKLNGIPVFNFIPQKSGLYEWTIYSYRKASTGELKVYPFSYRTRVF